MNVDEMGFVFAFIFDGVLKLTSFTLSKKSIWYVLTEEWQIKIS